MSIQTNDTIIYRAGSDFRLGGRQFDTCPHDHKTPDEAKACDYWDRYAPHPTVAVEMTNDGQQLGVIQYTFLELAAIAYAGAVADLDRARDDLAAAVRGAVARGMSESQAARFAGVDRMTVRKWLGK